MKQKIENNAIQRKGRTASLCLHHPTPRAALLSATGELRGSKELPRWERKNEVSNQLPQFVTSQHGRSLQLHLTQRLKKSRHIGTGWNNREQLGFPISATQQRHLWFTVTSSVEDPNRFHHWRNQRLGWLSWTPCRFHHCTSPHRFPHSQMPPNSPSLAVTRPCNLHWKPA